MGGGGGGGMGTILEKPSPYNYFLSQTAVYMRFGKFIKLDQKVLSTTVIAISHKMLYRHEQD